MPMLPVMSNECCCVVWRLQGRLDYAAVIALQNSVLPYPLPCYPECLEQPWHAQRAVEKSATRITKRDATCYVQRTTCYVQRATCNVQRATCNVQRATCNVQRATCNVLRATHNVLRATCNVLRATHNARASACTQPVRSALLLARASSASRYNLHARR